MQCRRQLEYVRMGKKTKRGNSGINIQTRSETGAYDDRKNILVREGENGEHCPKRKAA